MCMPCCPIACSSGSAGVAFPAPLSFPTRRSSDLPTGERRGEQRVAGELVEEDSVAGADEEDDARQNGGTHAEHARDIRDRKSTRLNSSHMSISYAVFCLKKKTLVDDVDSENLVDQ